MREEWKVERMCKRGIGRGIIEERNGERTGKIEESEKVIKEEWEEDK